MRLTNTALIALLTIVTALFHFGIVYSDSKSYIALTRFFIGEAENPPLNTLATRPLVPLFASLPSKLWGFPLGFGFVNLVLWTLGSVLLYNLSKRLFSERASVYAALLFISSMPTLLYFGAVMTEAGGFLFSLLPVLLYLSNHPLRTVKGMLAHLLAGIGLLAREVTYLPVASLLLAGMMDGKARDVLIKIFIISAPFVAYQVAIAYHYGTNFVTSLIVGGYGYVEAKGLVGKVWDLEEIAKAFLLGHYPLSAIFLLIGLLTLDDRRTFKVSVALLVPALAGFLAWPFRDLRIAIATYYATMPLAGYGMEMTIAMLRRKPILEKLSDKQFAVLMIAIQFILSETYFLRTFGRFSFPWDVYLFAPSSLKAGLD